MEVLESDFFVQSHQTIRVIQTGYGLIADIDSHLIVIAVVVESLSDRFFSGIDIIECTGETVDIAVAFCLTFEVDIRSIAGIIL